MEAVEGPEARREIEGPIFVGFFEQQVAAAGIFVAGYEAEDRGYDCEDWIEGGLVDS